MNCKTANKIDFSNLLLKLGFNAKKTNSKEQWFLSPFRNESTPSFKINIIKNLYYDFGEGEGGTVLDFIMKYYKCNIKEALEILSKETFSFRSHTDKIKIKAERNYSIRKVTELTNANLVNYINSRKINLEFAKRFLFQVHYSFNFKKEYYGIGFMNDFGGLEIRNKYFKGCLGKKAITRINNNSDVISLFESWSDFLSYLTIKKKIPNENFIILNSTAMLKSSIELLKNYSTIKTFFDNDNAGTKALNVLKNELKSKIIDNRIHYKNFNDLNDFLCSGL